MQQMYVRAKGDSRADELLYGAELKNRHFLILQSLLKECNTVDWKTKKVSLLPKKKALAIYVYGLIPIGCSFLPRTAASFSRRISLALALCRRLESLDFSCSALTSPPRFFEMLLRVFSNDVGIFCFVIFPLRLVMSLERKVV